VEKELYIIGDSIDWTFLTEGVEQKCGQPQGH